MRITVSHYCHFHLYIGFPVAHFDSLMFTMNLAYFPIPCLHITSFYSGEVAKDSEGGFTKHLQLTDVLGYLKFG